MYILFISCLLTAMRHGAACNAARCRICTCDLGAVLCGACGEMNSAHSQGTAHLIKTTRTFCTMHKCHHTALHVYTANSAGQAPRHTPPHHCTHNPAHPSAPHRTAPQRSATHRPAPTRTHCTAPQHRTAPRTTPPHRTVHRAALYHTAKHRTAPVHTAPPRSTPM